MSHNRQRYHSGPLPSCFRPITDTTTTTTNVKPSTPLQTPTSTATANLSTSVYHTRIGIITITWSRNLIGRSLRLHFLPDSSNPSPQINTRSLSFPTLSSPSTKPPSFHLNLKPYLFWNKHGHKKLHFTSSSTTANATLFWDFTHAKFRSNQPDPESGYYIFILTNDGHVALLLGDMDKQAHANAVINSNPSSSSFSGHQTLVVRREHVTQGATRKLHRTRAEFGGKIHELSVECDEDSPDPKLVIKVDSKKALLVKHLKWKFRGSERVVIDSCRIRISWDVYNWLFEIGGSGDDGFAVFTFRFEELVAVVSGSDAAVGGVKDERVFWSGDLSGKKKKKNCGGRKTKARSSSASSMSSASSSGCGSVLEWESVEENELKGGGPGAFSLVVYASKS